jgi:hypothetical protein
VKSVYFDIGVAALVSSVSALKSAMMQHTFNVAETLATMVAAFVLAAVWRHARRRRDRQKLDALRDSALW